MLKQLYGMRCVALAAFLVGAITGGTVGAAELQPDRANWDNLQQLAQGTEVQIVLKDAKSYRCKFQATTDESIVLRLVTGEQKIPRQNVLRVSSRAQRHRGRNALRGALIGAGSGLALGAVVDANAKCLKNGPQVHCSSNYGKGFVAGNGAFWGAIIGALVPTGGWQDVYRAR